jgi:MerR family transcriptional regulator, copper efflux regulator
MEQLTVGRLARAAGVGIETIRFYQKRGLLDQPVRRPSGYRMYDHTAVARIKFVKHAQGLGFTLKEVADLIELERDSRAQCSDLQVRANEKIELIERKISELERMRTELLRLSSACASDQPLASCELLSCLAGTC